ncbi:ubiquitin-like protein Pup [Streptomyces sp. SLBN-31]|uniref:ubiquitin-like protein Pup n=1 Tax=Streptomyces sp. SLBN-31 TaxID=2768444 RepID=UPI001153FE90|nr:ubiquitin-like protein Pup [Streptomyces sp. SLBN-31]
MKDGSLVERLLLLLGESFRLPRRSLRDIVWVYERRLWVFVLTIAVSGLTVLAVAFLASIYSYSLNAGVFSTIAVIAISIGLWRGFNLPYGVEVFARFPLSLVTGRSRMSMDEIDAVLQADEEQFVRSFVRKGGQGWSGIVDPSFFLGVVSVSAASGMAWDDFLKMMARILFAMRHVPGPGDPESFLQEDGTLDLQLQEMLLADWRMVKSVMEGNPAGHSVDESAAFHWALFTRDFFASQCFVRLRFDQFDVMLRRGASEGLEPSELAERIVDHWIDEHLNSEE